MNKTRYTYPKTEKLKSRILIEQLFTEGKSVSKYPLRLVYIPVSEGSGGNTLQISVSVSKRYFKRAADRNYFKRLLREAYRLNQHHLKEHLNKPYALMLLYQTRDKLSYTQIEEKLILLFEKFIVAEKL